MFNDTQEFLQLAGKNAAKAAEVYVTRDLFDAAIQSMMAAKDLNPKLTSMAENHITAYKVQHAVNLKQNYYKVLGVEDVKASREEIKKQFKKLALVLHPDKNGSVVAEAAFKSLSDAFGVLSNEAKRAAYDHQMRFDVPQRKPRQKQTPRSRTYEESTEDGFEKYMKSQGYTKLRMPSNFQSSYTFNMPQPQPQTQPKPQPHPSSAGYCSNKE